MGKRGPSPRGEYEGRTAVFSTRITPETKQMLVKKSRESGRSLSQEIEHRLRRSLDEEKTIISIFGDRRNYAIMRLLSSVLLADQHLAAKGKVSWLDDPDAFNNAVNKVVAVLELFRPAGPAGAQYPDPPRTDSEIQEFWGRTHGRVQIERVCEKIVDADPALPTKPGGENLHSYVASDLQPIPDSIKARAANSKASRERSVAGQRRYREAKAADKAKKGSAQS